MKVNEITDEEIAVLREELLRESGMQLTEDTDACGMALSEHPNPDFRAWQRSVGRKRCAELLSWRAKDAEIARLRALVQELQGEFSDDVRCDVRMFQMPYTSECRFAATDGRHVWQYVHFTFDHPCPLPQR